MGPNKRRIKPFLRLPWNPNSPRRGLNWFNDPWIFFGLFTVVLAILLIIVPQLQLFIASTEQEVGKFTFKTMTHSGDLEMVTESVKGFDISGSDQELLVERGSDQVISIASRGEGELLITTDGQQIKFQQLPDKRVRVHGDGIDFTVEQEVFSQSFFGAPVVPDPLSAEIVDDSSLLLQYHEGAYLSFQDKRITYSIGNYLTFITTNKYFQAVKNSLIVSLLASLFATVFAVSLAFYFSRYHFPGKNIMVTLITMASVSPPFLGGYAWRMLLGSQGILTNYFNLDFSIVGIHGVIWVVTWLIFPLIFLLTYDSFTAIDNTLSESSMSLGADKRTTLFKIIIPLAMPGIITGVYLGMMTAFSDFGTPYVISLNLNVLPVLVYQEFMNEVGTNFSMASTGSIVMILISSVVLTAQRIYLASKSYASISSRSITLINPPKLHKVLIVGYASLLLFFAFVPHMTVTVTSFLTWSSGIVSPILTLGNYIRLISSEVTSIYVSLFLGVVTTILNIVFGVGIAYVIVRKRYRIMSDFLNIMVMIPYIIPGTVLAIGFVMLFNEPPIVITGTWMILVLAYFVRKLPYSVKTSEAVLYQIHPDLEEAAKGLGAKPWKSFYDITFKLMIFGVISGATLSFLQVMSEISSTVILYRPPWKPMTAFIFENTTRAGSDFGVASAMTVVLMLILYIPLYLITKKTRANKKGDDTFAAYY